MLAAHTRTHTHAPHASHITIFKHKCSRNMYALYSPFAHHTFGSFELTISFFKVLCMNFIRTHKRMQRTFTMEIRMLSNWMYTMFIITFLLTIFPSKMVIMHWAMLSRKKSILYDDDYADDNDIGSLHLLTEI